MKTMDEEYKNIDKDDIIECFMNACNDNYVKRIFYILNNHFDEIPIDVMNKMLRRQIMKGHGKVVMILIKHGAKIEDEYIQLAMRCGREDIAVYLVKKGIELPDDIISECDSHIEFEIKTTCCACGSSTINKKLEKNYERCDTCDEEKMRIEEDYFKCYKCGRGAFYTTNEEICACHIPEEYERYNDMCLC